MNTAELLDQIDQMEDGYAAALANGEDARTLTDLWESIRELRQEYQRRDKEEHSPLSSD